MIRFIEWIHDVLWRSLYRQWTRIGEGLWPDPDFRAKVMMVEGIRLQEIVELQGGNTVEQIVVTPDGDGGYVVHVENGIEVEDGSE